MNLWGVDSVSVLDSVGVDYESNSKTLNLESNLFLDSKSLLDCVGAPLQTTKQSFFRKLVLCK
ncbi:hypothetical protein [uncultured Helicobacter sp.]|uniref:hypothetical protein n=1 Tax=uncultured Helicobacter sp. TaxID=175537 RepID=UPI0037530F5B